MKNGKLDFFSFLYFLPVFLLLFLGEGVRVQALAGFSVLCFLGRTPSVPEGPLSKFIFFFLG